jgi:hypothetical protein
LQAYSAETGAAPSACHAEGRGFESLQPLQERPAFAGLFRGNSRLVRLLRAGPKPDPRQTGTYIRLEEAPVCREFWIVRTVDLLRRRRRRSRVRSSGESGFSPDLGIAAACTAGHRKAPPDADAPVCRTRVGSKAVPRVTQMTATSSRSPGTERRRDSRPQTPTSRGRPHRSAHPHATPTRKHARQTARPGPNDLEDDPIGPGTGAPRCSAQ